MKWTLPIGLILANGTDPTSGRDFTQWRIKTLFVECGRTLVAQQQLTTVSTLAADVVVIALEIADGADFDFVVIVFLVYFLLAVR